jgi:2'-5' RNA ligase
VTPVPRSALIVEVPEAEPLVKEWRAKHDWSAQHGVPAHITLLFPFVPTERIDDGLHAGLGKLFAAHPAFSFSLTHVARFPDEVAWLAPEPAELFKALTETIWSQYPEYPPYEGIHDEVIHHLTVAEGGTELQDQVDSALTPALPIEAEARSVSLFLEDETGWWSRGERYPLAGNATGRLTPRRL